MFVYVALKWMTSQSYIHAMLRDCLRNDNLLTRVARHTHPISVSPGQLSAVIFPRPFAFAGTSNMIPVQLVVRRDSADNLLIVETL